MTFYDVKEDWDGVKKRWEAWWEFEMYDRPLLLIQTSRKDPITLPAGEEFADAGDDHLWRYTDPHYLTTKILNEFYNTWYGGESVPVLNHGWAVGHACTFGCEPHFTSDTIWTDTVPIKDGDEYPEIYFDESNRWWQLFLDVTEKVSAQSKQRYFVMPMWGNNAGDNLLLCRGSDALCMDVAENPEWVKENIKIISDAQIKQYKALREKALLTGLEGTVNNVSIWSPKQTQGIDSDFSCMVSPKAFRDIFLPPLIETMQTADHCIYHLDGAVALHQLDTLLATKEINAIQWVPGDGHWEVMQWIPLLQKMQAHKKAVLVYAPPEEVHQVIKALQPEGLCIQTWASGEDAARALLDSVSGLYR